jgi:hypothetical protein
MKCKQSPEHIDTMQLIIELGFIVCYNYLMGYRWCSILVSENIPEDGPKNPLKGTSMKFLVPATEAQSGVGAGG